MDSQKVVENLSAAHCRSGCAIQKELEGKNVSCIWFPQLRCFNDCCTLV